MEFLKSARPPRRSIPGLGSDVSCTISPGMCRKSLGGRGGVEPPGHNCATGLQPAPAPYRYYLPIGFGVADENRTRNSQGHNLALYR